MKNIYDSTYDELKSQYNNTLNIDKTLYVNSNDECTPLGCIEEMLNKIPEPAWNKDMEILDPCCGNGNFHLYAWDKLKSLGSTDKDIVTKNLYFNDINFDRLGVVRDIYGKNTNITMMDFLSYPEGKKYDMIYANPPYAKFYIDEEGNSKRASKNHTMVRDFLDKSLNVLKDGGILVFIIPDNWMSLADRNLIIKKVTGMQILHLNIHGAKKWFPKIGSSFTWLVLQKKKTKNKYTVDTKYSKKEYSSTLKSQNRSYIPLLWTEEVQSIISKTLDAENSKYKVQTSSDLHKYTKRSLISSTKDTEHPHRLIHTPSQTVWATRPHKFQKGYKVFISTTNKYMTFVDNCGMTQSIAFVQCDSQSKADEIKRALDHDLYRFLNNICRWGNFNNIRILQKMPIAKDPNDIWGSFNITEEEKIFILKVLNKTSTREIT